MTHSHFTPTDRVLTRTDLDHLPWTIGPEGVRTRGDFAIAVNDWKVAFSRAQIKSAALFFDDIFDAAAALFGCWCAGVQAILPADTSEHLCARLAAGLADACAGHFEANCGLKRIEAANTHTPCRDAIDAQAPLVALFTSGSTGEPTLVVKRLRQLFCEVESIEARGHGTGGGLPQQAMTFSTVSAQHIYGLLFSLLWPLSAARAVWYRRILYPEELIARMQDFSHCLWVASPAHLKRLPEHLNWASIVDRLDVIYSSGGPLSDDGLRRTIALTGQAPVELFGSSESGGIAWRMRAIDAQNNIVQSAFEALPGVQWRIENGLLVIKSEQLTSPDWETTSDRIQLVDNGRRFVLLGRVDRIVKIEEKRVSLTALEQALTATPWVQTAKLFVRSGSRTRIGAVCVLSEQGLACLTQEGKRALVERLREVMLAHVERVCVPRHWRFVNELPENSMGKHTTELLEALFAPGAIQAVARQRTATSAEFVLTVSAREPTFDGHFDGFAILPGLTQLHWVERLTEQTFACSGFAGVKALKFMRPIFPESTVIVRLDLCDSGVRFSYSTPQGAPYCKGVLLVNSFCQKGA